MSHAVALFWVSWGSEDIVRIPSVTAYKAL